MENVFEMLMVVCFGISWPLNTRTLYHPRPALCTFIFFYFFFCFCYFFVLVCWVIKAASGGTTPAYVWFFYILNTLMVSFGILLYFRNKRLDQAREQNGTPQ